MSDLTDILGEAVKGYASIEVAKASADGRAGYDYRPESIADQRYGYQLSGPEYATPGASVSPVILIGGLVLLLGIAAVVVLK